MTRSSLLLAGLLSANLLVSGMLGLYRTTDAAPPQGGRLPFDSSVEQRNEMIRELKEIKAVLKEQLALLRQAHERNGEKR